MNIAKQQKTTTNVAEYSILLLGLLLLLAHNFVLPISQNMQMGFLLTMVFIIGVPHGSLDFVVDEQNELAKRNTFSIKKFVTIYLSKLVLFSIFWVVPWLAFSLFIIFSIYHFGETDMQAIIKPSKTANLLYISYGVFILSILILNNIHKIATTVPALKGYTQNNNVYLFLLTHKIYCMCGAAILFFTVLLWQIIKQKVRVSIHQTIQFLVLFTIILLLPMMLAFTFYFALWHSIISLKNVYFYFKQNNSNANIKFILNKSILFSVMALVGLLVTFYLLKYFLPQTNMLFALLIILSVLTLPHLSVMHGMYKNVNNVKTL